MRGNLKWVSEEDDAGSNLAAKIGNKILEKKNMKKKMPVSFLYKAVQKTYSSDNLIFSHILFFFRKGKLSLRFLNYDAKPLKCGDSLW